MFLSRSAILGYFGPMNATVSIGRLKQYPGEVIDEVRQHQVALDITAHGRRLGASLVPTELSRTARPTGRDLRHLARSYGTDTAAERVEIDQALLAAQAHALGATLWTFNRADFAHVESLIPIITAPLAPLA